MDFHVLHTVLLVIIILLFYYYWMLSLYKTQVKTEKHISTLKNMKMENNKFKKICVENGTCYYSYNIITLKILILILF